MKEKENSLLEIEKTTKEIVTENEILRTKEVESGYIFCNGCGKYFHKSYINNWLCYDCYGFTK